MAVTVDRKGLRTLKPLGEFLKAVRKRETLDESAGKVAALLDRKIEREERSARRDERVGVRPSRDEPETE